MAEVRITSTSGKMPELRFEMGTPRIQWSMPIDWLARAVQQACARYLAYEEQSAPREVTARDLGIAIFEVGNALTALVHQVGDLGEPDLVDGLLFARNRTHHVLATAVGQRSDVSGWCWNSVDVFPPSEHADTRRRQKYVAELEGKPVVETVRRLVELVQPYVAHDPVAAAES